MSEQPDDIAEAEKIIGDMAFEHGCDDGVPEIWRVVYWSIWNERRLRSSEYFAREDEAQQCVERMPGSLHREFISLRCYRLAANGFGPLLEACKLLLAAVDGSPGALATADAVNAARGAIAKAVREATESLTPALPAEGS